MKLGIFADTHYCRKEILCRTRHPSLSLGKIKEAMSSFAVADVDLCICMGDLVDICDSVSEAEECITEVIGLIRSYNIQFVLIPGNHDYKVFSAEEFSTRTGCAIPPYAFDIGSHLLIMLDANYRSDNRRFDVAGVDWKDSNLPPEQLEFLYQTLAATDKPSIVLVHENLDTSVN